MMITEGTFQWPEDTNAVQVTRQNMANLAHLCRGVDNIGRVERDDLLYIQVESAVFAGVSSRAYIGEWVVKKEDGLFYALSQSEYEVYLETASIKDKNLNGVLTLVRSAMIFSQDPNISDDLMDAAETEAKRTTRKIIELLS